MGIYVMADKHASIDAKFDPRVYARGRSVARSHDAATRHHDGTDTRSHDDTDVSHGGGNKSRSSNS